MLYSCRKSHIFAHLRRSGRVCSHIELLSRTDLCAQRKAGYSCNTTQGLCDLRVASASDCILTCIRVIQSLKVMLRETNATRPSRQQTRLTVLRPHHLLTQFSPKRCNLVGNVPYSAILATAAFSRVRDSIPCTASGGPSTQGALKGNVSASTRRVPGGYIGPVPRTTEHACTWARTSAIAEA
ncbi:hypothetical protein PENSPDRAFT_17775 [Peniophora sp. CONT]|nr:hypothetical protein PENSPDRAFT_17775 [Peniophora sp. CONT]